MTENKKEHWLVEEREEVYRDFIFRIVRERIRLPRLDGPRDYYYHCGIDWVNVLAVDDQQQIIMIKQYRHAVRQVLYEVPAGLVEKEEADPAQAAVRELLEETGYAGEKPVLLGSFYPNPAIQSNRLHSYLVRGVKKVAQPKPEPMEEIEVLPMPLVDVLNLFAQGKVPHALTYPPLLSYLLLDKYVQPTRERT